MLQDLAHINLYCHLPPLAHVAKELMYQKWTKEYNQQEAMVKWKNAWGGYKIFRAHANDRFYGTLPSDNNMVERKNRTIKADTGRDKVCLELLFSNATDFLRLDVSKPCHMSMLLRVK